MSEIHILTGTRRGGLITKQIVFHYAIPVGQRVVNAVLDPELISFVSAVPDIETTELDAIKAGETIEALSSIQFHYTEDLATAVLARIRAVWNSEQSRHVNDYVARYAQYLTAVEANP